MADPRLGRIYAPDVRDREYLMGLKVGLLAPVTQKLWPVPHLYDQGQTPQCVGYSTSGALTALEAPATVVFNATDLYNWANANDGVSGPHDGTSVRAGFQGVLKHGDQVLLSTDVVGDPVGSLDKLTQYLWADTTLPDGDIGHVINWILSVGPVVIGIDWYNDAFTPNPQTGFISLTGGIAGGHAIVARGVNATDPNNTYFVLRQSWGPWGVTVNPDFSVDLAKPGGDALISKADLIALLTAQGEAGALCDAIPVPPNPPPIPSPPTPPPGPAPVPVPPAPVPPSPPPPSVWQKVKAILDKAEDEILTALGKKGEDQ